MGKKRKAYVSKKTTFHKKSGAQKFARTHKGGGHKPYKVKGGWRVSLKKK